MGGFARHLQGTLGLKGHGGSVLKASFSFWPCAHLTCSGGSRSRGGRELLSESLIHLPVLRAYKGPLALCWLGVGGGALTQRGSLPMGPTRHERHNYRVFKLRDSTPLADFLGESGKVSQRKRHLI